MAEFADNRICKPGRSHFYPDGLVQKNELAYASRVFNAIAPPPGHRASR